MTDSRIVDSGVFTDYIRRDGPGVVFVNGAETYLLGNYCEPPYVAIDPDGTIKMYAFCGASIVNGGEIL